MHFEITASQQAIGKQLTPAQRNSSLFSEAPRIGAVTLRRGQVLKFDKGQMKQHEVMLKRLFDAGAIEIVQVDGKERTPLREAMKRNEAVLKDVREELKKEEPPPPPPSAPKAQVKKEEVAPPPEPTPEPVKAFQAEEEPQDEVVSEVKPVEKQEIPAAPVHTENKGKKGKR